MSYWWLLFSGTKATCGTVDMQSRFCTLQNRPRACLFGLRVNWDRIALLVEMRFTKRMDWKANDKSSSITQNFSWRKFPLLFFVLFHFWFMFCLSTIVNKVHIECCTCTDSGAWILTKSTLLMMCHLQMDYWLKPTLFQHFALYVKHLYLLTAFYFIFMQQSMRFEFQQKPNFTLCVNACGDAFWRQFSGWIIFFKEEIWEWNFLLRPRSLACFD